MDRDKTHQVQCACTCANQHAQAALSGHSLRAPDRTCVEGCTSVQPVCTNLGTQGASQAMHNPAPGYLIGQSTRACTRQSPQSIGGSAWRFVHSHLPDPASCHISSGLAVVFSPTPFPLPRPEASLASQWATTIGHEPVSYANAYTNQKCALD
jgi:hypothetical protein